MRLKARDRTAISSGSRAVSTRALRSPPATRSAAWTSRDTGAAMPVATVTPTQIAPTSTSRPVSTVERTKMAWMRALERSAWR